MLIFIYFSSRSWFYSLSFFFSRLRITKIIIQKMNLTPMSLPTLYSFRRCPYAMRARLGILLSGTSVSLREIILKYKPEPMLAASPKGTVPVLILSDGRILEESLDIMHWALGQNDPHNLLLVGHTHLQEQAKTLIASNDTDFKPWLDKYKYADRFPENTQEYYRQQGEKFIAQLECLLSQHEQILSDEPSIADYAIFPFIRQFSGVDKTWFNQAPYPNLQLWLAGHVEGASFTSIMKKYPTWLETSEEFIFGD
ncbi:glutathione S-transferase domain protein [Shewanella violacea DSS12]|uniref:Glutathione S-transferase domain protein n=2 Tax=Shewanella violacea TaxID=60217 RepID=D4ZLL1_SHEVD|nr:glutathione S-transferase domain protein [Shewanella violacea DSS12]